MNTHIDVTHITINTDRLTLRPLAMDDLQDMYEYASVPGVGEMAGWKHHESIEETGAILQSMMMGREVLSMIHKADQKMIGTLGLHPVGEKEAALYPQYRMREVGYVLSRDYWGQGLMAEAVSAVIAYCFDTLEMDALICCHFAENTQSRRVIEKCGFRFLLRGRFVSERLGKTFDDMRYILFRDDQKELTDSGADQAQRAAD